MIAAFLFAATAVALIVALSLIFPGSWLDRIWELNRHARAGFEFFGKSSVVVLAFLALCTSAAAVGLLRGRKRAWWLAVTLFAANGVGDLVNLFITRKLFKAGTGVLVALAFLWCLFRPRMAAYFRPSSRGDYSM